MNAGDLASAVGMSCKEFIEWIELGDDRFFPPRERLIGQKLRTLDVPFAPSRYIFRRLNRFFQSLNVVNRNAHGGVKGRSSFHSARKHLSQRFVWTIDVTDCFPSITRSEFMRSLQEIGIAAELSEIFAAIFICRDRLPQGSPCSSIGLNIHFLKFDYDFSETCGKMNLAFSRMADDIVFSGAERQLGDRIAEQIKKRLGSMGLSVNSEKWEKGGIQTSQGQQLVHSLRVDGRQLMISDKHRDKARAIALRAVRVCRCVQPRTFTDAASSRRSLSGWYYYCNQTKDPILEELASAIICSDESVKQILTKHGVDWPETPWFMPHNESLILRRWQRVNRARSRRRAASQVAEKTLETERVLTGV